MKKILANLFAVLLMLCMSISLIACNKTSSIPDGHYAMTEENNSFKYIKGNVRDTYGWIIDGDTAEQWTSSMCTYKAKIVEKDGEILFDGYEWRDALDILLGAKSKRGSNHDYTVVYDEANGSITLTPSAILQ